MLLSISSNFYYLIEDEKNFYKIATDLLDSNIETKWLSFFKDINKSA